MVQSLENADKSKVYASRIEGLATVATSGDYDDLSNKPTIPDDSNLVHKTGNETIAGTKTFSSSPIIPTPATSDNSTKAATTAWVNNQGYLTTASDTKNTAGSTNTSSKIFLIGATSQAANPQTYSHDTVYVNTSGQLESSTPANSSNTTVVATTAFVKSVLSTSGAGLYTISKSGNGYCKFNSGLIIQWGSKSITKEAQEITYPTAFPSVARPCLCMVIDADAGYVAYIGSFSLTSFTVRRHGSDSETVNWIAIGY